MSWISIKDALPKIKHTKDGAVNSVLLWLSPSPDCDLNYMIANTEWVHGHIKNKGRIFDSPFVGAKPYIHKSWFTHWMYLPKSPKQPKTTFSVEWICNKMNDLSRDGTISRRSAMAIISYMLRNHPDGIAEPKGET